MKRSPGRIMKRWIAAKRRKKHKTVASSRSELLPKSAPRATWTLDLGLWALGLRHRPPSPTWFFYAFGNCAMNPLWQKPNNSGKSRPPLRWPFPERNFRFAATAVSLVGQGISSGSSPMHVECRRKGEGAKFFRLVSPPDVFALSSGENLQRRLKTPLLAQRPFANAGCRAGINRVGLLPAVRGVKCLADCE